MTNIVWTERTGLGQFPAADDRRRLVCGDTVCDRDDDDVPDWVLPR